jgi:hypothetical protein
MPTYIDMLMELVDGLTEKRQAELLGAVDFHSKEFYKEVEEWEESQQHLAYSLLCYEIASRVGLEI